MTVSVCNSVSYHSPPHLHSSRPKHFNWEGLDWLSELVIEIRTQCGYFNQHWLLYGGRNEPVHHGAAGHPSPEPQVQMEEWLFYWMWQSLSGANGSALTTDGYWDLCSPSKTIKLPLWFSTGSVRRDRRDREVMQITTQCKKVITITWVLYLNIHLKMNKSHCTFTWVFLFDTFCV